MSLDPNLFIHDSDRTAMNSLKAIPGFYQLMKAFMKVWNEKQFKLSNMSTNLRLGENQMKKYYDMLIPVCEKLGIDIPEIYVKLDVNPNAYTYGDTNPFIVITSGLFETVPEELIPSVIAHECGHIACHHSLYTTMGRIIMDNAGLFLTGLSNIAIIPLQLAFAYWMRCSEFSADRAAMICDGTSDKVIDLCMRFAGFDKDIKAEPDVDSFMKQAEEYKAMVDESKLNKTLEFIMYNNIDHPLNAVRAYEAREWAKTERFKNIVEYINSPEENKELNLPAEINPKQFIGKNVKDIQSLLLGKGFNDITLTRVSEYDRLTRDGDIVKVVINDKEDMPNDFYKTDSKIILVYYESKTEAEIALDHIGEVKILEDYKYFQGKNTEAVTNMFKEMGFTNIEVKEMAIPKYGLQSKENTVARVVVGQNSSFKKNDWVNPEETIIIYNYMLIK